MVAQLSVVNGTFTLSDLQRSEYQIAKLLALSVILECGVCWLSVTGCSHTGEYNFVKIVFAYLFFCYWVFVRIPEACQMIMASSFE